ncbi:MAG: T9SS type A sorting domain-containing protein [Candidatus Cloacimonetes bacterium]|nr:T9SS type A sorting domain-containing protein [Candidatus Cloacimonadota bacterium]MCF7813663.1 T9SS type A sorting domain-containing protein [Candidatus Cloacimonadota bacterium]MCF7869153.1 T9SS type A sorting domain-containing protein [Candidatus Cloacimonadota bacterium]MCF7882499.1 T9SS type A sorting domain-containing protein [Candidatus Cloacimonadota bacterium]
MNKICFVFLFLILVFSMYSTNNCLQFDGDNDYVSIADNSAHKPVSVTVEAWVYINSNTNTYTESNAQYVIFKQNTRTGQFEGYCIYYDKNNHFVGIVSSSTGQQRSVTSSVINLQEWNHVALTADGTAVKLYLNGIWQGTSTGSYALDYGTNPLYFGRTGYADWEGYFNGKIDEVRIWKIVRGQTEIEDNMNQELSDPTNENNLVAYYKFNTGSGQIAYDSKGNNDGTLGATENGDSSDPTWVTSDSPLPVTLSSFTGTIENGFPTLNWTTESELENMGWNIYRSENENGLENNSLKLNETIIPGMGTITTPTNYIYIDELPTQQMGMHYYWLESVSYSGELEIHGPVSIDLSNSNLIPDAPAKSFVNQNFPNPFNPTTTIEFGIEEGETGTLTIYNSKGQKILSQEYEAGYHSYNWDAASQASGIYFYQLKTDKYFKTNKMLMLK